MRTMNGLESNVVLVPDSGRAICRGYPIVKQVQKHFGNRLGFVFRNFPLNESHPNAEPAAKSAEFAATKQRFWEMHDALFEHQDALGLPMLLELAETLGLSAKALQNALDAGVFAQRIKKDFIGGVRSGVNGTPTFFINGHRHEGPLEFADLVEAIATRATLPEESRLYSHGF